MVIFQLNWNLHDGEPPQHRRFLYAHDDLQWLVHGGGRLDLLDVRPDGTRARLWL